MNQFNMEADEAYRLINSIAAGSKFGAAELQISQPSIVRPVQLRLRPTDPLKN
ncbi:hypothetical protein [Rhodohalobacter sp.]|uniref:hypothetical protein n=1 Tax=Rhodohalobacter sp. TaxID=1974210 RepID=UPI002ACE8D67|nr:hypothetical protein [Rhodohalobacter sp.]MDZ7758399.1 hypothetical protein [Rhodohalobacter sp.]